MEEDIKIDMTPRLLKDLGMRYPTENSSRKYSYGLYECLYCGKEWEVMIKSIEKGHTRSCGCIINKQKITHGLSNNKFYNTWYQLHRRCYDKNNIGYKHYGGRGIIVCEEWLDVATFITWAEETHPNKDGYTLDRVNNDLGYSPENCRWADETTQNINQRIRNDNISGVKGVYYHKSIGKWIAAIGVDSKQKHIGSFITKEEAVLARDNYIIENKLPHKLSTEY